MKRNVMEVKKRLEKIDKIRKLAAEISSPFKGMSLAEAIKKMRKVRYELWEGKLALRS